MLDQVNTEVYCFSYFVAKPIHRENLINALLALINPTRSETGCLQYELLIDNENPNFLIMLEKFTSQTALDEHEQQPYIKYFVENEMELYCEKVSWHLASVIRGPA